MIFDLLERYRNPYILAVERFLEKKFKINTFEKLAPVVLVAEHKGSGETIFLPVVRTKREVLGSNPEDWVGEVALSGRKVGIIKTKSGCFGLFFENQILEKNRISVNGLCSEKPNITREKTFVWQRRRKDFPKVKLGDNYGDVYDMARIQDKFTEKDIVLRLVDFSKSKDVDLKFKVANWIRQMTQKWSNL